MRTSYKCNKMASLSHNKIVAGKNGVFSTEVFFTTNISWKCALQNGANSCVNESQKLSQYRVSRTEIMKRENRFLTMSGSVWAVLEGAAMFTGSIFTRRQR